MMSSFFLGEYAPEGWNAIQRDLYRLEKWVHGNLMWFNRVSAKCCTWVGPFPARWGRDCSPLPCFGGTPPLVLHKPWGSSTGRTWTCWNKSRRGHSVDQRDGELLLWGEAERIGIIQIGREKSSGWPNCSLSVSREFPEKMGQDHVVTGQGGMGSNWKRIGLD